jgi:hypothetical protein
MFEQDNGRNINMEVPHCLEWLKRDNSVLEQLDNLQQSLVLKKKYFVNDTHVDQHDPVQLHLMYLQV